MAAFESLLVPIDFSPGAEAALEWAASIVSGDDRLLILLHVVDTKFVEQVAAVGLARADDVAERMRADAAGRLAAYKCDAPAGIDVETIVTEGVPFLEVLKKADDFQVDAVVMGRCGHRGQAETILFGSTAERVIRACTHPVIVLPPVPPSVDNDADS